MAVTDFEMSDQGDDETCFIRVRVGEGGSGNTILGQVRVAESRVIGETNSIERADQLRARLETACGGLLAHRAREHASPLGPPPTRAGRIANRSALPPDEEAKAVKEFLEAHYVSWPDHPLPALGGLTPRQAVKTKAGRQAVDVLLKSFENSAGRGPAGAAPDFSRLRRELRLDQ